MRKTTRYARTSALPAIAAALALSSTPVFAQEVPAQPTTPVTTDTATPPSAADPAPAPALDTTAPPVTDAKDVVTPTTTTGKPKHVAAAKPVAARTVTKTTTTRTTHAAVPAAAAPVAVAPAAPAAPAVPAPAASQSAVAPVVDLNATPAKPAPVAAKSSNGMDETTALELGGGALALIALGAGAWALSRRRRDEDVIYEDTYEPEADTVSEPETAVVDAEPEPMVAETPRHDPVEQPNIVAPAASAFAWGNKAPETAQAEDDGSDRKPGETWVERAYRGPSPANPSASLKNRLRRAAFFDKREREVAAGKAEPVDTDAGLPDAMVEEQERELA